MSAPRFASVVLDVDSTVCGIEGIDWLARRRGEAVAREIVALTSDAMSGAIPLEQVYGRRLSLIRPTRSDVDALAQAYLSAIAPDSPATIARMGKAGLRVALVSGGIRQALQPLARRLGIGDADLHAVDLAFDDSGDYAGFDESSPLTTSDGKRIVVANMNLPRPILAVGDGNTDIAMRGAADTFAAYIGFTARESVMRAADMAVVSFRDLARLVLG